MYLPRLGKARDTMAEILKVEPEAMHAMAARFEERAEKVKQIITSTSATISLLQSSAFKGHVGDSLQEKFEGEFETKLKDFQAKMTKISADLQQTVADYIAEDEEASGYFNDGAGGGGAAH